MTEFGVCLFALGWLLVAALNPDPIKWDWRDAVILPTLFAGVILSLAGVASWVWMAAFA
jgi:Flp pilus assembly protein TadB